MRLLVTLVVLAAAGASGWQIWQKHPEYFSALQPKKQAPAKHQAPDKPAIAAHQSNPAASPEDLYASMSKDSSGQPVLSPPPEPIPAPETRMPAPTPVAEIKRKMPPGQFLMTQRVSMETSEGVTAVVPSDTVKLLERRRDGTLKVTNGKTDFIVRLDQVTQDIPAQPHADL
jgi:hypothetical protein